jgi:glycosyltransferase involved in cell wall biosynthesis
MPNYNKSAYIAEAIESVLAQTMHELELIVIDDASTDGSVGIVEGKSRGDSRVVLAQQKVRRGASHCRNVGIRLSRADVIAFLDSDDVYAADALEVKYHALETSVVPVVVYSDCWHLDGSGRNLGAGTARPEKPCASSGMIFKEFLIHEMSAQANLMVPKAFFETVGLYDESVLWGENTDMILRLANKYPFRYIDKQLYGYRLHGENTWNQISSRQMLAMKTPVIEKHFRANIRSLDYETRQIIRRRLVERYFEAHRYRDAMANSLSSPRLFGLYLSLVSKKLTRNLKFRYVRRREPPRQGRIAMVKG